MTFEKLIASIEANKDFIFFDDTDNWNFKAVNRFITIDGKEFRPLAINAEGILLASLKSQPVGISRLFLIEENEATYYAFSLSELANRKAVHALARKIERSKATRFDQYIQEYNACPGSLYWIANAIMTTVYDEKKYNPTRNEQAVELYTRVAKQGDARACRELADYYQYQTGNKQAVLRFRTDAIKYGWPDERRELVDFIIDELPEKIDVALQVMHEMRSLGQHVSWTYWKEGNVYMKGIGTREDHKKGVPLIKKAAELGHVVAIADLSYFFYKGLGVEKDLREALQLIEQANRLSNNQYRTVAEKIKTEI